VVFAGVRTGNERIHAFYTVREAVFDEKIQCPIRYRRLRPQSLFAQDFQYIIGTNRFP